MNIQSWFVNYSVEAMCLLIVTEAKWHLHNYSTATDVRLSNGGPMAWVQRERFSGQLTELWLARILANVNTFISVVMHLFIVCMFWIPVMSWHCCCDFCWWQMFEVVRVFYGSFSQFSLVGLKIIKKKSCFAQFVIFFQQSSYCCKKKNTTFCLERCFMSKRRFKNSLLCVANWCYVIMCSIANHSLHWINIRANDWKTSEEGTSVACLSGIWSCWSLDFPIIWPLY